MPGNRAEAPRWFAVAGWALVAWGLLGCWSCFLQLRLGADAMGPADGYDRALYAALPFWYDPCFVVAVLSGTGGAVALVRRARLAVPLAWVALASVLVMFGYIWLATDIVAHKGVAEATGFPLVVLAIAAGQLWLARRAAARGWIG